MGLLRRTAGPPPVRPVTTEELDHLVHGIHLRPHRVLGAHVYSGHATIRVLAPLADEVNVVLADGERVEMGHEFEGIFVGVIEKSQIPNYQIAVKYGESETITHDPYNFAPTVGELDLHLIGEGRHELLWKCLGANPRVLNLPDANGIQVSGTSFAVWAPSAHGVRLVGDHNHWNGTQHPMRALGSSGIWELFVPGLASGTKYKYSIRTADGAWHDHADPLAKYAEIPSATASVVFESQHEWNDSAWLDERATATPWTAPVSIYEVHLGSWRSGLTYRQLATELVDYVSEQGFTHVEFMPVMEHPFGGSWGYQVTSFYAPTSRFGNPDDFRFLIDALHQSGIGVILDWVPAHFPKDEWALARFDGTPLYEHPDPRRGEHPDWGTYIFNFGRNEVRNFLVANALYWLTEFHVDGLRVDAVASMLYLDYSRKDGDWLPNEYNGRENLEAVQMLEEINATAYAKVPGIMMIAEESTAWPGVTRPTNDSGLGFGFKWNMGWMHDSLEYLKHEPVHRKFHHDELTFSIVYAWSENFILPISHDEVVHGKRSLASKFPGDKWQQLATARAYLALMWSHPGKQLLFMGSEFGQTDEWSEASSLPWHLLDQPDHLGMQSFVRDLNHCYRTRAPLWEKDTSPSGFNFLISDDRDGNTIAYSRWAEDGEVLVCAINFSPVPQELYQLPLPFSGRWREVLNSDELKFGGSGVTNTEIVADGPPIRGQLTSALLRLPPLGAIWLERSE
ncbi:MAG TPA: 1,4-alpha-glucan branching protein GlgB [Candidatus Nanopelagicaceae bacterium]|nr:1,4-alpha-glucan branching protein GlgB [Candidatus Nanopelagicaceae bacterium]